MCWSQLADCFFCLEITPFQFNALCTFCVLERYVIIILVVLAYIAHRDAEIKADVNVVVIYWSSFSCVTPWHFAVV